jgi:uncharacterized membrane-anchored protein
VRLLLAIRAIGYFAVGLGFLAAVADWSSGFVIAGLVGGYVLLGCWWICRRQISDDLS